MAYFSMVQLVMAAATLVSCSMALCDLDHLSVTAKDNNQTVFRISLDLRINKAIITYKTGDTDFLFFEFYNGVEKSYKLMRNGTCIIKNYKTRQHLTQVDPAKYRYKSALIFVNIETQKIVVDTSCNPTSVTVKVEGLEQDDRRKYFLTDISKKKTKIDPNLDACYMSRRKSNKYFR